ncbi:MAG: 2OG-Fe dioxygenase family protein, partial [Thiohalomonadales bacterium]
SYNNLKVDTYLAETEKRTYRYRRYGAFCLDTVKMKLTELNINTFEQSKFVNSLYGGIIRQFPKATDASIKNPFLKQLILADFECLPLTKEFKKIHKWFVGFHKIRITTNSRSLAHATPEGIHCDGHQFVVQHFISRQNIIGGVSQIYDRKKNSLDKITFDEFLDTCFVDDKRVMHSVSPLKSTDNMNGYRDMLIIDFEPRCKQEGK